MSISDYDVTKELVVASVSGTPTISKAQPIYLSGGDDSATGTGPVVLDWTGINGPSDIAVYDESGNLLDYEIEELDTTNETGVLWVYNSWVRDGTVQCQIGYGNGPEDRSMAGTGANPWGNGQSCALVQHLGADPLSASDSSPKNLDGTVNGATSTSSGEYNGAAQFDGADDYINFGDPAFSIVDNFTCVATFNPTADKDSWIVGKDDDSNGREFAFGFEPSENRELTVQFNGSAFLTDDGDVNDGNEHLVGFSKENTVEANLYRDGQNKHNRSGPSSLSDTGAQLNIGRRSYSGYEGYLEGMIDEVRIYTEVKNSDWFSADYDASAKAGQVFFSEFSEKSVSGSVAQTDDSGVAQTDSDGVVTTG